MRKSIVSPSATTATPISDVWRDLERIARVENQFGRSDVPD